MKKLLSLLAVITVTAPVAVNVVACGSSSANPGNVPTLSSVLTTTDLGTIGSGNNQKPTAAQILAAVIQLNPSVNQNAISVNASSITTTSAEIDSDGVTYTGNVTVTFVANPAVDLSTDLTTTDLGTIGAGGGLQPTDGEILQAIQNLNPQVDIGSITLSGQSKTGAIATGDGQKYMGQVSVTFITSTAPIDISKVITNTSLGTLGIGADILPSEADVLSATASLNPDLNVSAGISVLVQDAFTALIYGDGTEYIGAVQVTFLVNNNPAPLGQVLKVTSLGTLGIGGGTLPTDDEILAGVIAMNPTISPNNIDVDFTTITNNSADIIGDDILYSGSVTVTFTVNIGAIPLNQVLLNTALGTIGQGVGIQPTDDEIKAAILAFNPGINPNALTLSTQTTTGATVTGDNLNYQGDVNVTFITNTNAINLPSVLTVTSLGTIGIGAGILPTASEITTAIGVNDPNVNLTKIAIANITMTGATVNSADPTYYTGSVNVTFVTSTSAAPLNQVVTTTDLGTIGQGAGLQPTNAEIIAAVVLKNPIVDSSKISVQGTPTMTTAIIGGDGVKYSGTVNVTFTTNTNAINLATVLTVTNLGTVGIGAGILPTAAQITTAIGTKNPGVNLPKIAIANITMTGATVNSADPTYYTGSVNVTFVTSTAAAPINQVVTTTNLGTIGQGAGIQPTNAEIIAAVALKNPIVDSSKISVQGTATKTSAVIAGDGVKYSGTVNVTFTTNTTPINLGTVLTVKALGTIGTGAGITPTAAQIITAVGQKNPNVNTAKISVASITTQGATINSADPTYYLGSVNVTYTTNTAAAPLNQVVTVTALGTIGAGGGAQPTNSEILTAVNQKNPIVDVTKISVQGTATKTSAVIAGDGVKYSGTVNVTFVTNTASIPLNQVLRNTDLGALGSGNGIKPTAAQITTAIGTKNPGIDTTAFTISNNTTIGATVTGNGTKYSGTVNVVFTTTNTAVVPVNGTSGNIRDFTVTADGTTYAIDFSKPLSVFKKGPSDANFTVVTVVPDSTSATFMFNSISSNGNDVWVMAQGHMYKKLAADTQFTIAFSNFDTGQNNDLTLIGHNLFYIVLKDRIFYSTNLTPTSGFQFNNSIQLPTGANVTCMALNAAGDLFAGTVTGVIYKVPVGTNTFTAMTGTSGVINAIAVNQATGAVYAGGANGIFVSNGTAAFSGTAIAGYDKTKPVTALAFDNSNNLYIGNNNGNIYELISGDTTVSVITGGAGIINTIIVGPGNKMYFGSNNGKVYRMP